MQDLPYRGFITRNARLLMAFVLVISDLAALMLSGSLALAIWSLVRADLEPSNYVSLIPLGLVFLGVFFLTGLYAVTGMSPVEEFRRLIMATTSGFLGMGTLSFYVRDVEAWSRASFGLAWLFALILIPLARELTRQVFCRWGWWGERAAIIGYGPRGQQISQYLLANPKLGIRPAVAINGFQQGAEPEISIPVLCAQDLITDRLKKELKDLRTAILVVDEIPPDFLTQIIENHWTEFPHLVMVSSEQQLGSLWITPYDIGGILGLEVRQNLLDIWQQRMKRLVDIVAILLFSPLLALLFALLALAIRLDSKGSIFYLQKRIGRGNRPIRVVKFRTMVAGAEQALDAYLEAHPECRDEWEANHKLKNDPRITVVGRFLRRSSLDELPQIINVLLGEMSLVGPRPIVQDEVRYYANRFKLYTQVLPGITGLWQISGRNDVNYEMRVHLDEYYVRNWSIWLDFYIFTRTLFVVISGKGAY